MQEINYELIRLMTDIHEFKGKQIIYLQYNTRVLEKLKFSGLYHNVKYACALSGITIADTKLMHILQFKRSFSNEQEAKICGFRDAMLLITEDYDFIDINIDTICTLYLEMTLGDTEMIEKMTSQQRSLLMDLCSRYNDMIHKHDSNVLLEIFCFMYHFNQSNIFNENTILFSRLLLHLLLYKSNILVTQYQSIDQLIFIEMSTGRKKLRKKDINRFDFHDELNYMDFYFKKLIESYEALDLNFKLILDDKITPLYRVLNVLNRSYEPISRNELEIILADISRKTIERALVQLQKDALIEKTGQGKATKYRVT